MKFRNILFTATASLLLGSFCVSGSAAAKEEQVKVKAHIGQKT